MAKLTKHFNSPKELRAWTADKLANDPDPTRGSFDYSMKGIARTKDGLEMLVLGDESHVKDAEALLANFNEKIEVEHSFWSHDVAGYFPDVPTYLAGSPENMYVKRFERSDRTPLRVWVGVTSSAGVREDELVKRGVTLAAFALAMMEKRPVILTPYVNLGDGWTEGAVISWDVSTQPLVIGELMASLVKPEIIRYVGIYACQSLNQECTGSWDPDYQDEAKMRVRLGAEPDDLYLGSIHLYDPLLQDPMGWIKAQLAKYSEED